MVLYRLIGQDTTNSSGVASVNYTGTGKGLTQIVASTDDPSHISEGSLQSETFDVWDTLVHDENVTAGKIYNYNLEDRDFYCEFIVHPSSSTDSRGMLVFSQDANNIFMVGDLYSSTNNNCGINWSGGTFYGKQIPVDEDTLVTVTRTGTDIILTVGVSTYSISDMRLELNTLTRAIVENNSIKNFMLYLVPQTDKISIRASANTIQTDDNVTITGRLHYNGEIVKNTDLDVYKNGVKVGTANTGSTGVASYTYTGVGAGATEFQFKYGSLVSEIYAVWDTIYSVESINDLGCSDNVQLSETSEGYYASTPSTTSENQIVYFVDKQGSNFRFPLDKSWCFELDFKTTNAVAFGTHNSVMGNKSLVSVTNTYANQWHNIKIKYDVETNIVTGFFDDTAQTSREQTVTGTQGLTPRILDFNQDMDIVFKNVKSYYI